MNVEFWSSPEGRAELLISASEFVKAQKSEEEFQSLVCATEAFAMLLGYNYSISDREYEHTIQKLKRDGTVILSITAEGSALLEVSGSNHHIERIAIDGRIIGHFNPKAIEKIRARNEKEAKRK